ncbi:MAG: homocysteine methyltransferase [Ignavibacteria bacterium]|nr:homocysteine methyltransferase [Ignavibacteria bacterium]
MKRLLHDIVRERRLVCDGAMGTQLMLVGLDAGGCGEYWNLIRPERVVEIHRRYVEAGADCIITNTFGANRVVLRRHGYGEKVREINSGGVRLARTAASGRETYILGGVGPLGAILQPYGDLPVEEARNAFDEQCSALVEAGVDAIIIETQTSLEELGIAIQAAKSAWAKCIIASLAFDLSANKEFFVTMMGVLPEAAAEFIQGNGAHIVGLNCGTGIDMAAVASIVQTYRKHTSLPTMGQPNAGLPVLDGGRAVYKQSPKDMASGVLKALEAGTNIIGSCCGSTPEHTRAIREVVDMYNRG